MIKSVKIANYKSVMELELELGRINVFIGENGSGKSNILEAIALASAAYSRKLDNQFLGARGVRVSNPVYMRSAFDHDHASQEISIRVTGDHEFDYFCNLQNDNKPYSKWWARDNKDRIDTDVFAEAMNLFLADAGDRKEDARTDIRNLYEALSEVFAEPKGKRKGKSSAKTINLKTNLVPEVLLKASKPRYENDNGLTDFLIYSPENSALRKFEDDSQVEPLGIRGEGLYKLLSVLNLPENKERLDEVKRCLTVLGWFSDFDVLSDQEISEKSIEIKDRYISGDRTGFDQKSANEGFLFLLFYYCLFASKDTPRFFAVDNVDISLNPKLCEKLILQLVELSRRHDKQVILTTHSPAILDGINLDDEEQRLFVVQRNRIGQTVVKRVGKQKPVEGTSPVRLSEAFLRGYLGGLPKGF